VKFVSDEAGFVDLAIRSDNPDILFASPWERVRGPYFLQSGGPGGARWKRADGGDSWTKVEGPGWPTGEFGRIGVAISRSDPEIMYANVEAEAYEDDGRTWISPNDGGDWEELTGRFPGVPEGTWVRRIEPSSHDPNTFFVAFDGHRTNDFTPYVYMTTTAGRVSGPSPPTSPPESRTSST
jgi:hypothetical protein